MSPTDPIIAMLAQFQPLFTTPTWKKMMTLLTGTLLARGRRTVTAALWQTGHHLDSNFSRFHQVLNRARWSPLEASRQLLSLIMETFIQAGGGIDVVIDETLERRWGAKISKRGHYRDSALSNRERSVSSPGLRWIVMAVVVTLPWTQQCWALPFLCVLATTPLRKREAGQTSQDGGYAGTSDGQSTASLASQRAYQAHGRYRLQYPGTGTALCRSTCDADRSFSLGLGDPPTSRSAHQTHHRSSACGGKTIAIA